MPSAIAIALLLLTLGLYFFIGFRKFKETKTIDDFFYYGRSLDQPGYEKTFVVTGISLATVLFFFLDFGGLYGLPLLLSPLMFCLGTYFFWLILPRLKEVGFLDKGTTLANFIGQSFNSKALRISAAVISILGYLGTLVIEIYVGVQIFQIFFKSTFLEVITAILLLSLISLYTFFGGFRAVIETDRLQFRLILSGVILALFSLTTFQFTQENVHRFDLFPYPGLLPVELIVILIVGNLATQILRLDHWQRAAATKDLQTIKVGLNKGMIWSFAFWAIFCLLGMLWYWIDNVSGHDTKHSAVALLHFLKESAVFHSYVVFPILFSAFIAALISTADSAFVMILTSVVYDLLLHKELHDQNENARFNLPEHTQKMGLKVVRKITVLIFLITSVMYYWVVEVLQFTFVDLLFVLFIQQIVLFPAVIIALRAPHGLANPTKYAALAGIWTGWLLIWTLAIWGRQTDNPNISFYAATAGWLTSIGVTILLAPKTILSLFKKRSNT